VAEDCSSGRNPVLTGSGHGSIAKPGAVGIREHGRPFAPTLVKLGIEAAAENASAAPLALSPASLPAGPAARPSAAKIKPPEKRARALTRRGVSVPAGESTFFFTLCYV
jgi:hypothetical protein